MIKESGNSLLCFGCDKDRSDLLAISSVWNQAKIRLCFWHAERAVQMKLKSLKVTDQLVQYRLDESIGLVDGCELCWGSVSERRPSGPHRYGQCQCISRERLFERRDRLEAYTPEARNTVIEIFTRHFNHHSFFPDNNGIYLSPEAIYRSCVSEMYAHCGSRNFHRLWAYLWVNWYRQSQWQQWAK